MLQWERRKLSEVQTRGSAKKEEKFGSKKLWTTLFLQVLIADKDFEVAASLFCTRSHRQIAKSFQRNRFSGQNISWNEDSVRVLPFFVDRQGFENGVRGKGLCRQEAKWLCANPILKKTKKDFWAEWGLIFVVHQSQFCLLIQKSEVKSSTLRGIVECR